MKNHIEILEPKNTITKLKNSVDGLISRMEKTEERISEPENRTLEITQSEQQWENRIFLKNEQRLRDMWWLYQKT